MQCGTRLAGRSGRSGRRAQAGQVGTVGLMEADERTDEKERRGKKMRKEIKKDIIYTLKRKLSLWSIYEYMKGVCRYGVLEMGASTDSKHVNTQHTYYD